MRKMKIGSLILICSLVFFLSFQIKGLAYVKEGYKLSGPVVSYKWGESLTNGLIKTGWTNGISSWESSTSSNIKIDFFYHGSSVHFLTRFTEADTEYYGKMSIALNSNNIVTKFQGYINDIAVKTANVSQSTAVHELGHALGIGHTSGTSIMNSYRDRTKMITPQTDDINGVKSIY